jgi:hypothetical protein
MTNDKMVVVVIVLLMLLGVIQRLRVAVECENVSFEVRFLVFCCVSIINTFLKGLKGKNCVSDGNSDVAQSGGVCQITL